MGLFDSFASNNFISEIRKINEQNALKMIPSLHRMEFDENPRVFCKGVRATLIGMGFSQDFVEGEFREELEKFYEIDCTHIIL